MEERKAEIGVHKRAEIFHETFDVETDAAVTLAQLVRCTGEYLESIVGGKVAAEAMKKVVAPLTGRDEPVEDWRATLEQYESQCFSEWVLGQRLHDLAAYAHFGIALATDDGAEKIETWLAKLISDATDFLARSPVDLWLPADRPEQLERLVRLAEARWALDHGSAADPLAVADFGGVSHGRMRNMMSGEDRVFNTNEHRKIPAHEALRWLGDRESFWNSIWRDERHSRCVLSHSGIHCPVFLPVARDGTIFHPGLKREGSFSIGEKGSELRVASFDEALAELQTLSVPAWRRPNEAGNWGLVKAVRWERLDRADLELFLSDPRRRL